jgi:hypothetical protein
MMSPSLRTRAAQLAIAAGVDIATLGIDARTGAAQAAQ